MCHGYDKFSEQDKPIPSQTDLKSSQLYKLTFGRKEVIKTHSTSVLSRIPRRLKVTVWESSIDPLPHHPTKNTRCAPTLWLSIFHFCTLRLSFLFVLSYYYYQGNFSSHPLTQRVPLPQHHGAGVSQHFSDRGRTTPTASGGGGISHGSGCTETSGLPEPRWGLFICDPISPAGLISFYLTQSSLSHWTA